MGGEGAKDRIRPTQLFWGAVSLLVIVSAVALFSSLRLMNQYEASSRSQETLLELDFVLSAIKDVESGARGFAITRDPRYLESYRSGNIEVRRGFQRLRKHSATEDILAQKITALEEAAQRRIAISDTLVGQVAEGYTSGQIMVTALTGKAAMDEVRNVVSSLNAEQQKTYALRREAAENQAVVAYIAFGAGVALSLIALMWLFTRLSREIHRRQEIEDELRDLNADLEERVLDRMAEVKGARDLLNEVVENLPDMVLLKKAKDDGFEYVLINAAGEKLLGRKREEVIGKTARDLFPPEEAESVVQANRAVIDSGRACIFNDRTLTTPQGVRMVETRMVPIASGSKMILALVRDVTEQKLLASQVREMQRLDAIGRLTGGVAHDFNNLLAVIVGSVELVREKLPDGSEMATFADEAINAAMRGADLVRRLLAFARKQHLEPIALDLNERLPSVVPLLQRTLGENIQLQVKSGDKLWPAKIDPTQFDDALLNLAINARDAMPLGGTLTIETANVELDEDYASHHMEVDPGDYVMLAVSDTGAGMPPEIIARAFEPFFTTKDEGMGTGLGLSQVFGWAKQSRGHIKIYSELDHGTTIKLYLPRAVAEAQEATAQPPEEISTRGHEAILVVEDNPNVRRTVKRQLAGLGYSVLEAEDGESALALIRSGEKFDLMLTDVVMPGGIGGYELAAQAEKVRPSIKVIFTSGYTELAANRLQTTSNRPLLSKPYTKRDLGRAIRLALDEGDSAPS